MNNKVSRLLKDSLIFGLGSLGSKLILFFLVPLYTNYLSKPEYGTADLVFTIGQLMIPFVSLVIFDAVIRFGLSKFESCENVLLVGILVFLFSSIIGLVLTPVISLYETLAPWKWHLYFIVDFSVFNSIGLNYLKVKDKNKLFAGFSVLQTALVAILNIIFLVIMDYGISGYLLAYIFSTLIIDVLLLYFADIIKDLAKASFDKDLSVRMLKYSTPLILNNVSWWVVHSSDRIMVEVMVSASALGLYTAAAKMPSLINVIVSIFQQAWGISAVKEIESTNDNSFYSFVFRYLFLFTAGACIILVSIMKPFMSIYVGNTFFDSWKYVPLLLVSAVFAAVASYYGSLYGALKKSVNNMFTTLAGAGCNLVLNLILIPRIGVWGAVFSTLTSYILLANLRLWDVRRFIPVHVDVVFYLFNCLLIIVQAILVSFDFYIYIVSLISITIFILFNFKYLKRILMR